MIVVYLWDNFLFYFLKFIWHMRLFAKILLKLIRQLPANFVFLCLSNHHNLSCFSSLLSFHSSFACFLLCSPGWYRAVFHRNLLFWVGNKDPGAWFCLPQELLPEKRMERDGLCRSAHRVSIKQMYMSQAQTHTYIIQYVTFSRI